jgi:hypothetical protein
MSVAGSVDYSDKTRILVSGSRAERKKELLRAEERMTHAVIAGRCWLK